MAPEPTILDLEIPNRPAKRPPRRRSTHEIPLARLMEDTRTTPKAQSAPAIQISFRRTDTQNIETFVCEGMELYTEDDDDTSTISPPSSAGVGTLNQDFRAEKLHQIGQHNSLKSPSTSLSPCVGTSTRNDNILQSISKRRVTRSQSAHGRGIKPDSPNPTCISSMRRSKKTTPATSKTYQRVFSVLGRIAFLIFGLFLQVCEFAIWVLTILFSPHFFMFCSLAISAYVVFFAYTRTGVVVHLIKGFPDKAYEHAVGKYCEYIRIGCRSSLPTKNLGGITNNIANQVVGANDIFDMITAMGNRTQVSLGNRGEHKGIWELAAAIEVTENIEDKDFLVKTLKELSENVLGFGDKNVELTSIGITSANWIIHEFKKVNQGLDAVYKARDPPPNLDTLLKEYVKSMDNHLGMLLNHINGMIPLAKATATDGQKIYGRLIQEENQLRRQKKSETLWQRLVVNRGWKGERFKKDMEITTESIDVISATVNGLLTVRSRLVQYRTNVVQFAGGITRIYASDTSSPEQGIQNLSEIIAKFDMSLNKAKQQQVTRG